MAEEVKKIITVEVGKSITSVRDFKKHIEDLRGALLGLNEESEEYKTIAEQIATDQEKLNEVMKVGKGNTDSAAGSYNELNNQLKALRQQYKALSETERNSTTGQAILQNITKLDTELKDIDESMGQYYRNVGNYKGAFEEAFKAMAQNIGNVNPELGKLMKTASSLIPLIKSASKAATTGLKGVKAALASTGIGLLVVALGEIIANWEQISNWVNKVLGKQKELTAETKNTATEASNLAKNIETAFNKYKSLLSLQGLSLQDQLLGTQSEWDKRIQENTDTITTLEGWLTQFQELADKFSKAKTRTKQFDLLYDTQFKLDLLEGQIREITDEAGNVIDRLGDTSLKTVFDVGQAIPRAISVINADIAYWKGVLQYNIEQSAKIGGEIQGLADKNLEASRQTIKAAEDQRKTEEELRKDQYQKEYWDFYNAIQTKKKQVREELQVLEDRLSQGEVLNDEEIRLRKELNNTLTSLDKEFQEGSKTLLEDYNADIKEINRQRAQNAKEVINEELEAAKALYNELLEYAEERDRTKGKSATELLNDEFTIKLNLLHNYNLDTTHLIEQYYERLEQIERDEYQQEIERQKEQYEKLVELQRNYLQERLDNQAKGQDWSSIAAESKNTSGKDYKWDIFHLFPGEERPDIQKEREQIDQIYQIEQQGYMDRIDLYRDFLSVLKEGSEEYLETERAINQEKMGLAELEYQHDKELSRRVIEDAQNRREIITTLASNSASIWSSFTDAMLANEEQGSNKWKAFKTSEAVVNMLSGILAAFMSGFNSGIPAPWNIALATSTAAVAAATGAAQIAQIRATKMGSTTSANSGTPSGSVGVQPLLNPDYDLQRLTNLSLQSDAFLPGKTQVYVLESDIQEVGNRVQVRENNATF